MTTVRQFRSMAMSSIGACHRVLSSGVCFGFRRCRKNSKTGWFRPCWCLRNPHILRGSIVESASQFSDVEMKVIQSREACACRSGYSGLGTAKLSCIGAWQGSLPSLHTSPATKPMTSSILRGVLIFRVSLSRYRSHPQARW